MLIDGIFQDMTNVSKEQLANWVEQCLDNFPVKKYQVIYADPPWSYSSSSTKSTNNCEAHYPTMSIDELKALPVKDIAEKDCALFMWSSNPHLPKAIDIMEAWGFKYKTVFKVWRKQNSDGSPVTVPGWWSRSSTELLLVGAKGTPLQNKMVLNEAQEYCSQRESHSEKPDEIRDCIFNFLDVTSRIELFSRKVCDNWDSWGLETPGYFYDENVESSTSFHIDENSNIKYRSFGVQVDTLLNIKGKVKKVNRNIKKNGRGGVSTHKPDCSCCVCKNRKTID